MDDNKSQTTDHIEQYNIIALIYCIIEVDDDDDVDDDWMAAGPIESLDAFLGCNVTVSHSIFYRKAPITY